MLLEQRDRHACVPEGVEDFRQRVVETDELRRCESATRCSQPGGYPQGRSGEVEAGHVRSETRQRNGVGADVALQVHSTQPREFAQPRQVELDDLRKMAGVVSEHLQVVAALVVRNATVPVGLVDALIVGDVDRFHGDQPRAPCNTVEMELNLSADEVLSTTRAVRKRLDFDKPVPREVI